MTFDYYASFGWFCADEDLFHVLIQEGDLTPYDQTCLQHRFPAGTLRPEAFHVGQLRVIFAVNKSNSIQSLGFGEIMVGQKISLSGSTQPWGLTVSSRSWTLPGTLVKSYSQAEATAGTAAISNADLSGGTVGYYWIAGGTENVSYTATFGVVSLTRQHDIQRTTSGCHAALLDDNKFAGGELR